MQGKVQHYIPRMANGGKNWKNWICYFTGWANDSKDVSTIFNQAEIQWWMNLIWRGRKATTLRRTCPIEGHWREFLCSEAWEPFSQALSASGGLLSRRPNLHIAVVVVEMDEQMDGQMDGWMDRQKKKTLSWNRSLWGCCPRGKEECWESVGGNLKNESRKRNDGWVEAYSGYEMLWYDI